VLIRCTRQQSIKDKLACKVKDREENMQTSNNFEAYRAEEREFQANASVFDCFRQLGLAMSGSVQDEVASATASDREGNPSKPSACLLARFWRPEHWHATSASSRSSCSGTSDVV
jgi:hypothetical protein